MNEVIHSINSDCAEKDEVFIHSGYVYACSYSGGSVKVGMSLSDPEGRIRCHDHTMRVSGRKRVDQYISKRIGNPRELEAAVIARLSSRFTQLSREWFKGADMAFIRELIDAHSDKPKTISRTELASREKKAGEAFNKKLDDCFGIDKSTTNGYSFVRCMDFAKCMEQVMRSGPIQDHEDLDLIERNGFADCSQFHLMAAIALFTSPRHEWDELFSATASNPAGLMTFVQGVMHHYAAGLEVA